MSNFDIIRAWKDEEYRENLGAAGVPDHPAGLVELQENQLGYVAGGNTEHESTLGCCHGLTNEGSCWYCDTNVCVTNGCTGITAPFGGCPTLCC